MNNPWDEWKQQKESQRAKEAPEVKAAKLPAVKRPITEDEKRIADSLRKCTFGVGSWDKKFVRSLEGATEISEKQSYWIYKTAYRYRHQMRLTEEQAKEMLKIADSKLERE